jgi:hypothetical protein
VMVAGCNSAVPTAPTLPSDGLNGLTPMITIAGVSTLSQGSRAPLRAFASDGNGQRYEVTMQVTWRVRDLHVASIDADGWITAHSSGNTVVIARLDKAEGRVDVSVSASPQTPSGSTPPSSTPGQGSGSGDSGPTNPDHNPSDPCLPPPLPDVTLPAPCPYPVDAGA